MWSDRGNNEIFFPKLTQSTSTYLTKITCVCVCITYLSEDLHMTTPWHTEDSTPSENLNTGSRKALAKNDEKVMFYHLMGVSTPRTSKITVLGSIRGGVGVCVCVGCVGVCMGWGCVGVWVCVWGGVCLCVFCLFLNCYFLFCFCFPNCYLWKVFLIKLWFWKFQHLAMMTLKHKMTH